MFIFFLHNINILFQAEELSIDEGDLLFILDQTDANWWRARRDDKEGLIPSNYGKALSRVVFLFLIFFLGILIYLSWYFMLNVKLILQ